MTDENAPKRAKPNRKKKPPRLRREEVARLIEIPSRRYKTGIRNRAIIVLLWRSGLRCSEMLDLTPRDIDYERGIVSVIDGKGGKDRDVYIDFATIEIVKQWLAVKPRSRNIFCTLKGGRLSSAYIREMLARYGAKAEIPMRVRPHLLRHTFASEYLEDGGTLLELQVQLGHARLETTTIYAHHSNVRMRKWANGREWTN